MKLHGYWRSSASWRVRIGLAYKALPYESIPVNLLDGAHLREAYRVVNPLPEVPVLEAEGARIGQSLAILQYLEESYPEPPLLPDTPLERAYVRQLAEIVNSGIHPLQNQHVLKRLGEAHGFDQEQRRAWAAHFISRGFSGLERLLAKSAGSCCVANTFSLADCCLAPQIYNARRFGVEVGAFPTIARLEISLLAQPAVSETHPEHQPDAVKPA